ncbi:high affinity sulphate transporter 1 [Tessaracoccus bendigoensis DSM 12906]|uniref:High affinity sulphate transporter 1 n=1 Tax=Tessaracoccus bendigoensis DSM 12906 TaxID=1123357 RepID=A0A1M6IFI4_9ACTN|nr:SulP family inorganic anion transporter [Tessaracoccus bendigoensis]SHJ33210.1 high affinity sulphate transporter 1 [Tessaracoccus bendigoensis DSM 12906]
MQGREPRLWEKLLPGVVVLRGYERSWLRGDLVSGVTVAAYLIPQVMAYAVIAGLPAVVGLWAVLAPMVIYAVLGTSRQLSIGPESTTALMTAAGVGALVASAGGAAQYAEVAAMMAIAVGVVCIVGWALRLGFLAALLSRPVLIGYMAGIAVMMIVSQLGKVTKIEVTGDDTLGEVVDFATRLGETHVPTMLMSLVVLALLFLSWRLLPRAPGPLIVLLGAAAVVAVLGHERLGLDVVGEVPAGLPTPRFPGLGDLTVWALLPAAVGIAVVGYSDNVLTSRAFAAKRDEHIDPGQELLALGSANIASGIFQGFPVSSSGSRTVLGDSVGSRTQLHSLVAVLCVVACLLFAGPVLSSFPDAALGALVIYAAVRLIYVGEIRRIARFRRSELILTLLTTVCVVAFGVLVGVGIAVGLSLLDLIRRMARAHDGILGYVPGVPGMHDVDDYPDAVQVPGLVVYRYDSPLFFANAEDFLTRAEAAVDDAAAPVRWFLMNAEANVEVDLTAVDILEQLRQRLAIRGIVFAMARVKQDLQVQLDAAGFADEVGQDRIFATLPTAVRAYADWHCRELGEPPPGLPEEVAPH